MRQTKARNSRRWGGQWWHHKLRFYLSPVTLCKFKKQPLLLKGQTRWDENADWSLRDNPLAERSPRMHLTPDWTVWHGIKTSKAQAPRQWNTQHLHPSQNWDAKVHLKKALGSMRNNLVFPSFSLKIMENFFLNEAQEKVTMNDFFQWWYAASISSQVRPLV